MADSSCEFVGPDVSAAVSFESYPRFIKGDFQDYEGLGIKRSTANSKHVPSVRSRLPGNNVFWSLPQKVVEFLELHGASVSCPTLTRSPTLHSVPCHERKPRTRRPPIRRYPVLMRGRAAIDGQSNEECAALGQRAAEISGDLY